MPRQIDQTVTDVRREIMDAASELFATEGYTSTSMRKIANKIGYSPTTIYLYFRDKDDLLRQICDATFAELTRNVNAINQLSGEPLDKLRLGLKEYILFGLRHPLHYHVLFEMNIPRQDPGPAASDPAGRTRQRAWMGLERMAWSSTPRLSHCRARGVTGRGAGQANRQHRFAWRWIAVSTTRPPRPPCRG